MIRVGVEGQATTRVKEKSLIEEFYSGKRRNGYGEVWNSKGKKREIKIEELF